MLRLIIGLALVALPVLELALLIKTGQVIGFWATLGLVIGAGVLGGLIWSWQGLSVARKARQALAQGRPPVGPVLDGAFLLLAGALLIMPGFLTDVLALVLLVPAIRNKLARWSVRRLVERAHVQVKAFESRAGRARGTETGDAESGRGPIIEGEFERLGEKPRPAHPGRDVKPS